MTTRISVNKMKNGKEIQIVLINIYKSRIYHIYIYILIKLLLHLCVIVYIKKILLMALINDVRSSFVE